MSTNDYFDWFNDDDSVPYDRWFMSLLLNVRTRMWIDFSPRPLFLMWELCTGTRTRNLNQSILTLLVVLRVHTCTSECTVWPLIYVSYRMTVDLCLYLNYSLTLENTEWAMIHSIWLVQIMRATIVVVVVVGTTSRRVRIWLTWCNFFTYRVFALFLS